MRKSKNGFLPWLGKLLQEMVPVILGILIALFINDYRERSTNERFVEQTMQSISREISENRVEIEAKLEEHYVLRDTLQASLEDDDLTVGQIISNANGFRIPSVKNTAWQSFFNQNMHLVDYEVVATLTEIEEKKKFLQLQTEKFIDFAYANLDSGDYADKVLFNLIINDFISNEESLLEYHDRFYEVSKRTPMEND